jgi:methylthioribose-1-phosphate isomerase
LENATKENATKEKHISFAEQTRPRLQPRRLACRELGKTGHPVSAADFPIALAEVKHACAWLCDTSGGVREESTSRSS